MEHTEALIMAIGIFMGLFGMIYGIIFPFALKFVEKEKATKYFLWGRVGGFVVAFVFFLKPYYFLDFSSKIINGFSIALASPLAFILEKISAVTSK